MKTLLIIILAFIVQFVNCQKIQNKGQYILYANGTGDTVSISKDKITVHQIGILVYLEILDKSSSIPLYYGDFGYSNSTQLRQYVEKLIYSPSIKVYNKQFEDDTLIVTETDKIYSLSVFVNENSTDSLEIIATIGTIGNMTSDTILIAPNLNYSFNSEDGVIYYFKFIARDGCKVVLAAIKND